MRRFFYFIVCFMPGLSVSVLAADKAACMLEGQITIKSVAKDVKDCLQNNGVESAQFKATCESIYKVNSLVGGSTVQLTYIDACPSSPQAICEGFFGKPMSSYYYKREAQSLVRTQKSCVTQGGKWR